MDINIWYANALKEILRTGPREVNRRTGVECASLPGLTFQCDAERNFPLLSLRKIGTAFIAEQMWFLSGRSDLGWLSQHTRIWDQFAETDGTISSAYGDRWRKWRGQGVLVDQLGIVVEKLKEDPTTRHGVVMTWDPDFDLTVPQKNVPCPVMFTVNVIGGRLNLHLVVRSNDMVLGFPTDAAGFALLLLVLAQELGVRPGTYTHSISNAHIYANHQNAAKEMAARADSMYFPPFGLELPEHSYDRGRSLDEYMLDALKADLAEKYRPADPIMGLTIAV